MTDGKLSRLMKKYYLNFVCGSIAMVAFASTGQTELAIYAEKFPNENGAFIKKDEIVEISVDKSGRPVIAIEHDEERIFLNDNCKLYSKESIGFSAFNKVEDVNPVVYIPNGDKFKSSRITEIIEEEDLSGDSFYDDNRTMNFLYTGLVKGAKTSLTYREVITEPHFFGSFYFSSYLPVASSKYQIKTPADMEIVFKLFGNEQEKIIYKVETVGKYKIHTWEGKDLKKYDLETNSVGIREFATHLQVRIGRYSYQGETKYILRDVDDLYEYYTGFVKDINKNTSPDLRKLADSLTAGLSGPSEKVKAILYWVQDNIKYVAFEDGLGGFIPREADLVYKRKFGDCKDMTSILYAMINSVGIPAYYTWIGTRDIPYGYSQFPSPTVDNHMICSFYDGEKYVFLDGTGKGIPYGMTTSFIQGKEALIGINEHKYELVEVPVVEQEANATVDTVFIEIKDELVTGHAEVNYVGYNAIFLASEVKSMSPANKEMFYEQAFKKGNNKCKTQVDEVRGLDRRGGPLVFDYSFEIADYVRKNGDELYLNPFLKKYRSRDNIDLKLELLDKQNVFKEENRNVVFIQVPEGYKVDYLPEGFTYNQDKFGCDVLIRSMEDKNMIEVQTYFYYNYLILESEHFPDWNEMIKKLNNVYSELIIFKKENP